MSEFDDLKKWIENTRNQPLEEMASFFDNRIGDYDYHECNILSAEKSIKETRLVLVFLTQKKIKVAMCLLGIQCPEEM